MNLIKKMLFAALLLSSAGVFARGGDDVGNGGFAYKQSVKILKMATAALEDKIRESTLSDIIDHPERRTILQDTLEYDDLDKLSKKNQYNNGRKLAMNYIVNPATVIILKPYFEAFMGKTDTELDDASLEVQKRLLHEAAHIWGYNEDAAEVFAIAFLKNDDDNGPGHGDRPTGAIEIKSDFCSCMNGKSDIINSCDAFCATKPVSDQSILYVNTILGPEITLNSKLGNLYNWCTVQLKGDSTTPQCSLVARDGTIAMNLPVNVTPGSNSFSANIASLSKDHTWILRLEETKTGSDAQSKEFQIRRKGQPNPDPAPVGALKITPVSQYTCMHFGGKVDSAGNVSRTGYARLFYYFAAQETPSPMPPTADGNSMTVCHDEQLHPGNDSSVYERLELIPDLFRAWDRRDIRFTTRPQDGGKLYINKILEDRLANEYGITGASLSLFSELRFLSRPSTSSPTPTYSTMGFIMVPFTDYTGKSYCPTSTDYLGNQPLFNLLGEYMDDTEGLYIAEKEAEIIQNGATYSTFYGTMFVRESTLNDYGFYIQYGLKIKATPADLNTKTIYYYWPTSPMADPMTQGNRKLFTVKYADQLEGSSPMGGFPDRTSDKRIGCVAKGGR